MTAALAIAALVACAIAVGIVREWTARDSLGQAAADALNRGGVDQ